MNNRINKKQRLETFKSPAAVFYFIASYEIKSPPGGMRTAA